MKVELEDDKYRVVCTHYPGREKGLNISSFVDGINIDNLYRENADASIESITNVAIKMLERCKTLGVPERMQTYYIKIHMNDNVLRNLPKELRYDLDSMWSKIDDNTWESNGPWYWRSDIDECAKWEGFLSNHTPSDYKFAKTKSK